jgi:hypothetical protein
MINKKTPADLCPGMYLYARNNSGNLGKEAGEKRDTGFPEQMIDPVENNRVKS